MPQAYILNTCAINTQKLKLLPCYALKSNIEKTRSKLKEDHLMQTTQQLFTAIFLQHTARASGSRAQISQFFHLVLPTSWQIVFTPTKPRDQICMLISCARLGNRRLCRKTSGPLHSFETLAA